MLISKKGKKCNGKKLDTSLNAYRYMGLNFTDEQYEDLCAIGLLSMNTCKEIPVHTIILVLKCVGLLPSEFMGKISDSQSADNSKNICDNEFEKKYGRFKD